MGVIAALVWGQRAALSAGGLGMLATAIQLVAHRLMAEKTLNARSPFPAGWLAGSALRVGGIVVMVALVLLDRTTFAPLPAALGYLGVLIPLLMLELKKT
jgi:hypothetical protein